MKRTKNFAVSAPRQFTQSLRQGQSLRQVSRFCQGLAAATLAACGSGATDAADTAQQQAFSTLAPEAVAAPRCTSSLVDVKLSALDLVPQKIFVKLCLPAAAVPNTVQLLVHGITYDNAYWDFPDPTGNTTRYSYSQAANAAGFATLAIDRLGAGLSSHPLSTAVSIDSNAYVVHQLVQALRTGRIAGPEASHPAFAKVVLVGHSYGSWTSWFAASRFHDVDGVVLTGVSHSLRTPGAHLTILPNVIPAALDPKFGLLSYDPGYLTTEPGTRYQLFCAPAVVDPAVVAVDEATKGTLTVTEFANYLLILAAPLDIRVPVLLVNGSLDSLFCAPPGGSGVLGEIPGGVDCTSAAALSAAEAPRLGPSVPSVDSYILPASGHDLNLMLNAPDYFAVVQNWVGDKVGN